MAASAICKIKHSVKLSALLASRQCAKCFILHIARARLCFNCFKKLAHERLVKAYLFQLLPGHQLVISGKMIPDNILCKLFSK